MLHLLAAYVRNFLTRRRGRPGGRAEPSPNGLRRLRRSDGGRARRLRGGGGPRRIGARRPPCPCVFTIGYSSRSAHHPIGWTVARRAMTRVPRREPLPRATVVRRARR